MAKIHNEHKEPVIGIARCVIGGNSYVGRKTLPGDRLFAYKSLKTKNNLNKTMNRWEYKIISIEIKAKNTEQEVKRFKEIEDILDENGENGWELISATPRFTDFISSWDKTALIHLFLKRETE